MRKIFFIFPLLFLLSCSSHKLNPDEIVNIFKRHSYAETDFAALQRSLAGEGMSALAEIDPRAAIIDPKKRPERDYPAPVNTGCGLLVFRTGGKILAAKVFEGSSAFLAGIREGDALLALDGKEVPSLSDAQVNRLLFGSSGGGFSVRFEKKGGGASEVKLTRDFGLYPNVWGFVPPGSNTGYVRIMTFSMKASAFLKKQLASLEQSGVKELTLDVRHNSGGSLEELAGALGLFSDGKKLLFKAVSRHPGYTRDFAPRAAGAYSGMKMHVLADSHTLSRAEIFAASLKEMTGALIIGSATAGDVSITKTFRLSDGRGLKLTVARMFPPSGLELEGSGLVPDIAAPEYGESEGLGFDLPAACLNSDPAFMKAVEK
ncbi:MAG: S41 family peptidase [Elusimicrobia bacterium]|nr:S41 family peptidase [Elusimicrobiota bacterium]